MLPVGTLLAVLISSPSGQISALAHQGQTGAKPPQTGTPQTGRAAAPTTPAQQPQGQRGTPAPDRNRTPEFRAWAWWNDADIKKELGLTDALAHKIDNAYQKRQRELAPLVASLSRANEDLDQMIQERKVPPEELNVKVLNVESLRSKLSESRTMMLYGFYLMLTPDQYNKLRQAYDLHFRPGRGSGNSPR